MTQSSKIDQRTMNYLESNKMHHKGFFGAVYQIRNDGIAGYL